MTERRGGQQGAGGVRIRPYAAADASALFEAIHESMAELLPWMPWCHPGYSMEEAQAWIEFTLAGHRGGTMFDFAIEADGSLVGACGINRIDALNRVANLGYWVRTSRAGQGIVTRAVHQLIDWALANTRLERIEIVAAVDNVRSQRVAERVGARREAVLAKRAMAHGRPSAAVMYAVLRPDP
jgi:RimJ/RimL family protein N-acetyltransferase